MKKGREVEVERVGGCGERLDYRGFCMLRGVLGVKVRILVFIREYWKVSCGSV